jgi:hypothetical protein
MTPQRIEELRAAFKAYGVYEQGEKHSLDA